MKPSNLSDRRPKEIFCRLFNPTSNQNMSKNSLVPNSRQHQQDAGQEQTAPGIERAKIAKKISQLSCSKDGTELIMIFQRLIKKIS